MSDEAVTMTGIAFAESGGRQGFGCPSSFQIISAGGTEAGNRLFVGNLTMHSSDVPNIVPETMDEVLVGFDNSDIAHPDFLWLPAASRSDDGSDIAVYGNYPAGSDFLLS